LRAHFYWKALSLISLLESSLIVGVLNLQTFLGKTLIRQLRYQS
jgi:hypothetical protein